MKSVRWFMKNNWIVALMLGVVCYLIVFNVLFNVKVEYPEEQYVELEDILHSIVDVENKTINYGIKVPNDVALYFSEKNRDLSITVNKPYEKFGISCNVIFDFKQDPKFIRDASNKQELNLLFTASGIIISAFWGIVCFVILLVVFYPLRVYISFEEQEEARRWYSIG